MKKTIIILVTFSCFLFSSCVSKHAPVTLHRGLWVSENPQMWFERSPNHHSLFPRKVSNNPSICYGQYIIDGEIVEIRAILVFLHPFIEFVKLGIPDPWCDAIDPELRSELWDQWILNSLIGKTRIIQPDMLIVIPC